MPRDHAYYRWYRPVTRKYVDHNNAKLDIMIESHLALLEMLPVGSREHNHVRRVLNNVVGLGGGPTANGHAKNGHETEPVATAIPSTSTTPLSTSTRERRATASPSTSAAKGCGQPATASPSTSAARGHGWRAITPWVVTSPKIPAPIPHASPQSEVPPPMIDASLQPEVPSPTPPSQPSFDLDEHPLPQPPPQGKPQRARRAPTCGTGGHKIGHKGSQLVCTMMSLRMMPRSLLPRPNITRGLENAKLSENMRGDLKKIEVVGRYLIEIWKAVGMDIDGGKVEFLWFSKEINSRAHEYWPLAMDIARRNTVSRITRCCQIMGRSDKEKLTAAQIFYPCMQCANVFFLKADICQLGMDQRKVNVLAGEFNEDVKRKKKPIILSHHMLPGLQKGQEKMLKSDPLSSIFMEDDEAEVNLKIKKAYSPPDIVEGNPCLEYVKYLILPWFKKFVIKRSAENDGDNLEDLFNFCSRKLSLKTVLMLADQMVYVIDFGLAKKYRDTSNNQLFLNPPLPSLHIWVEITERRNSGPVVSAGNLSKQKSPAVNDQISSKDVVGGECSKKPAGEEPLPEEDPANPIFKPVPEPSRLDSFLITNQMANYCNQINGVAGQNFSRLHLMKALHEN
ncbi:hypothetical protein SO802_022043 [Lithocarpus litseifolius]|uniref:tyrosine--tRNA ligase n=1 Tax=Lithocarpus litseifolius TaxID=425828 RepID=A0AAW2CII3_9ROSI